MACNLRDQISILLVGRKQGARSVLVGRNLLGKRSLKEFLFKVIKAGKGNSEGEKKRRR